MKEFLTFIFITDSPLHNVEILTPKELTPKSGMKLGVMSKLLRLGSEYQVERESVRV